MTTRTRTQWRNWSGNQSATTAVATPDSVDAVAELVATAAADGTRIKPIGSGHSFTGIGVPEGIQLDMSALRGVVGVDGHRVTLRAGTRLHEIPALLAPFVLGMRNLGDIDRQTITGATSTGTHGTGLNFGGISTQIVGAKIVTGTGDVVTLTSDDDELRAVALGLGALGVIVELTIECVDAFSLRAHDEPLDLDDAVGGFLDRVESFDHHEFYWFPHTRRALAKTNTRLPADATPSGPGAVRRYIDDDLISNKIYGVVCELGRRAPTVVPTLNRVASHALSERTYVAPSAEVFASIRDVRFREMEYAVELPAVAEVLNEIEKLIARKGYRISFPVEVRAAAADDLMLSTASGRTTGYIAVHRYHRDDPADISAFFADVEEIMVAHHGRPHWGKLHTRDAEYFRAVYPQFDDFLAVRDKYDPSRVFSNDYLRRVLGD
ncbi:D-arabinono-1,4-lactone oxidase [Gordonia sp. 852002-50395_SCH5434458]|uniref:D-arabinono-1,4-lactone oxidase n=1 Tax=Gordonia sp. 852002-50395_SCH5434458 TaxID=1834090 RepID=UPI0007EC255D|nr:D-arabinono-1,4-lactone oxidase [Gordonia sp. 852002-50395_SCH5434458]OBC02835.1 FAD-linked oxidoreductase [Gordonia sp. 852002-50395_SCH5434458]